MHRYEPAPPRAVLGFFAATLAVATFAIAVVVPSATRWGTQEVGVVTQNEATPAHGTADGVTTTVDVVAVRSTRLVPVQQSRASQPKADMPG